MFVLADEGFRFINRLGNIAIFPHRDVQLVGNLAVNEAVNDKVQRRDAVHRDATEGTDIHAVMQMDSEAVFADVADKPVRGMVADIGHAKTLRHAGEHTSV